MSAGAVLIFGGTAAYHIDPADFAQAAGCLAVETPFGLSPTFYRLQTAADNSVWFGSRHGQDSLDRTARFVNHRANLWAARALGTGVILSWNGVGAINRALRVGDLVVPAAIMDWTRHRIASFGPEAAHFDRVEAWRAAARTIDHINGVGDSKAGKGHKPGSSARPFDDAARSALVDAAETTALPDQDIVYVCTEGPRLETAAEIQLAAELGADVVGMTLCPEVWLAAELGLDYASLGLVTNFATGRRHFDPRREFGPVIAERALPILLAAADRLAAAGQPVEASP